MKYENRTHEGIVISPPYPFMDKDFVANPYG